jgi:hypothetical protein
VFGHCPTLKMEATCCSEMWGCLRVLHSEERTSGKPQPGAVKMTESRHWPETNLIAVPCLTKLLNNLKNDSSTKKAVAYPEFQLKSSEQTVAAGTAFDLTGQVLACRSQSDIPRCSEPHSVAVQTVGSQLSALRNGRALLPESLIFCFWYSLLLEAE